MKVSLIRKYNITIATNSETSYFAALGTLRFELINVTFNGIKYSDSVKSNSYLVRYDNYGLHT